MNIRSPWFRPPRKGVDFIFFTFDRFTEHQRRKLISRVAPFSTGESDFDLSRYYVSLVSFPRLPSLIRADARFLPIFRIKSCVRGAHFKAVEKR